MRNNPDNTETTIAGLLAQSATELKATSRSARLDAELLLAHVLGRTRAQLYGAGTDRVKPQIAARFVQLVAARREGCPVAQLVGSREFWSLQLAINEDTLVPRAETELLVECVLRRATALRAPRVLELGTGSGAIALALATERPDADITATDLSASALAVARYNAGHHRCGNIRFSFGDWFGAVDGGRYELIVSNPPYVADQEWMLYQFELAHEPALALRGGRDGLAAIRRLVGDAPAHLEPGGWLLIEHGFRQGPAVAELFQAAGLESISTYRDLPGNPRVTEGRRPARDRR